MARELAPESRDAVALFISARRHTEQFRRAPVEIGQNAVAVEIELHRHPLQRAGWSAMRTGSTAVHPQAAITSLLSFAVRPPPSAQVIWRSEEHSSELTSLLRIWYA